MADNNLYTLSDLDSQGIQLPANVRANIGSGGMVSADYLRSLGINVTGAGRSSLNAFSAQNGLPSYAANLSDPNNTVDSVYNRASVDSGFGAAKNAYDAASKRVTDFQFQDLADVFAKEAERLGLSDIASQIAKLRTESNTQTRTLEDLPDTIRGSVAGAGASLTTAQLNRQAAAESRPLVRNISDLLQSVSVLRETYQGGLEQAKFSTGLAGERDQNLFNQLTTGAGLAETSMNSARANFGSLFEALAGQLNPPEGSLAREREEKELSLLDAQIANLLGTGSGGGRGGSGSRGGGGRPGSPGSGNTITATFDAYAKQILEEGLRDDNYNIAVRNLMADTEITDEGLARSYLNQAIERARGNRPAAPTPAPKPAPKATIAPAPKPFAQRTLENFKKTGTNKILNYIRGFLRN